MRNTKKLGQILHAAQITLEDRTLSVLTLILHIEFALFVQWGSLSPTSAQLVKAGGKEKRDLAFYFLWGGVKHEAHYVKLLFIDHDHGIWIQGTVHLVI